MSRFPHAFPISHRFRPEEAEKVVLEGIRCERDAHELELASERQAALRAIDPLEKKIMRTYIAEHEILTDRDQFGDLQARAEGCAAKVAAVRGEILEADAHAAKKYPFSKPSKKKRRTAEEQGAEEGGREGTGEEGEPYEAAGETRKQT